MGVVCWWLCMRTRSHMRVLNMTGIFVCVCAHACMEVSFAVSGVQGGSMSAYRGWACVCPSIATLLDPLSHTHSLKCQPEQGHPFYLWNARGWEGVREQAYWVSWKQRSCCDTRHNVLSDCMLKRMSPNRHWASWPGKSLMRHALVKTQPVFMPKFKAKICHNSLLFFCNVRHPNLWLVPRIEMWTVLKLA